MPIKQKILTSKNILCIFAPSIERKHTHYSSVLHNDSDEQPQYVQRKSLKLGRGDTISIDLKTSL